MELTNRIPHMMTVRQVAKTGLISEYALRQLVKQTSLDKGTQRKTTENELPSLTQCTA